MREIALLNDGGEVNEREDERDEEYESFDLVPPVGEDRVLLLLRPSVGGGRRGGH